MDPERVAMCPNRRIDVKKASNAETAQSMNNNVETRCE